MDGSGSYPVCRDIQCCVRADGSHRKGGEMEIEDLHPEDYDFVMRVLPNGHTFMVRVKHQSRKVRFVMSIWHFIRHPKIWYAEYKVQRAADKISKAFSRFLEDI
jgi:hypothetical protein